MLDRRQIGRKCWLRQDVDVIVGKKVSVGSCNVQARVVLLKNSTISCNEGSDMLCEDHSSVSLCVQCPIDRDKICSSITTDSAPHHYTSATKAVMAKHTTVGEAFTASTVHSCSAIHSMKQEAGFITEQNRILVGKPLTQRTSSPLQSFSAVSSCQHRSFVRTPCT